MTTDNYGCRWSWSCCYCFSFCRSFLRIATAVSLSICRRRVHKAQNKPGDEQDPDRNMHLQTSRRRYTRPPPNTGRSSVGLYALEPNICAQRSASTFTFEWNLDDSRFQMKWAVFLIRVRHGPNSKGIYHHRHNKYTRERRVVPFTLTLSWPDTPWLLYFPLQRRISSVHRPAGTPIQACCYRYPPSSPAAASTSPMPITRYGSTFDPVINHSRRNQTPASITARPSHTQADTPS